MNVTLRQLRAFVALAEAGTFTAGARQLHVTTSALSLLIKEVEGVVGLRLFERTTRQTRLSPAGRDFLPTARALLDEFTRAIESLRAFKVSERGVLRVASSPTYAAALVPDLVARYQERHPGIRTHVVDAPTEQVAKRVAEGDADLGIAPERAVPIEVQQVQLFRDRLHLVCRADHPLAARKRVTWEKVLSYPFISLAPDYAAALRADLAHHSEGLTLEPVTYVNFLTTALALVKSGRGVTAQPAHALMLIEAYGLVACALDAPRVERRICLITPRDREPSPAAVAFRAYLAECFSQA